jgi:hypothetical protein
MQVHSYKDNPKNEEMAALKKESLRFKEKLEIQKPDAHNVGSSERQWVSVPQSALDL